MIIGISYLLNVILLITVIILMSDRIELMVRKFINRFIPSFPIYVYKFTKYNAYRSNMSDCNLSVWLYTLKSKKYTSLYGFDDYSEQPPGKDWCWFVHPEDKQKYREYVFSVLEERSNEKCINVRMYRKKHYASYECRILLNKDGKGRPVSLIGSLMDLTRVHDLNQQLENQYQDLQTILKLLPIGVEIYNENGSIVSVNDMDCNIFGIPTRKDAEESNANLYENPIFTNEVKEKLRAGISINEMILYDFNIIRDTNYYYTTFKDKTIYLDCRSHPVFDSEGKLRKTILVLDDITERYNINNRLLEANQKFELAIHNSGLTLWVLECDSRVFTLYNKELNNEEKARVVSFERLKNIIHEDDAEVVAAAENILLNRRISDFSYNIRLRFDKKSPWLYCTISGSPFRIDKDNNKVLSYVGFIRDNTRLVKLNQQLSDVNDELETKNIQLRKALEKAKESDKLKSAFLANMSHEIRTPLNAILGFSELIKEAESTEEREEYFVHIESNNQRLLHLISDILDLSKLEAGMMKLNRVEFDMSEFFDEFFMDIKLKMNNPNVVMIADNPYKKWIVNMDKTRVAQVIGNFATNAIKCTEKGYIKIGYSCSNDGLKVYVEDTGKGIPDSKKDRLFKRFEKLDDFTQGTGLGLSICKAIADTNKGEVGFKSQEGEGSTFWAWFPIKEYQAPIS